MVAEKTAKNFRGLLFLPHPVCVIMCIVSQKLPCQHFVTACQILITVHTNHTCAATPTLNRL